MATSKEILDELEDRLGDVAQSAWSGAKSVFLFLFLGGWSSLWGLVLLLSWAFGWATGMALGGGILAATLLTVVGTRLWRRWQLAQRAEQELVARARLEGLKLDRNVEEVLQTFDVTYRRARAMLEDARERDPPLATDAELRLDNVREKLFAVAKAKTELLRDLRKLGRRARLEVVRETIEEARDDITARQREAEAIAADAHRLTERLSEVRKLSAGTEEATDDTGLKDVLEELDRTAKAYKEIDEVENETRRKLAEMRARQAQRQG